MQSLIKHLRLYFYMIAPGNYAQDCRCSKIKEEGVDNNAHPMLLTLFDLVLFVSVPP